MSNVKKDVTEQKPAHIIEKEEYEKSVIKDKRLNRIIGWTLLLLFAALVIGAFGWVGFIQYLIIWVILFCLYCLSKHLSGH